jgi:hypothetical protein
MVERVSLHFQKECTAVGFDLNDKMRMLIEGNFWLCVVRFKLDVSHSNVPDKRRPDHRNIDTSAQSDIGPEDNVVFI